MIHGIKNLPPSISSPVLDSGGALSPFGIALAKKGYHVIVADPLDHFGHLKASASAASLIIERSVGLPDEVQSIGGIDCGNIISLAEATETPMPPQFGIDYTNRMIKVSAGANEHELANYVRAIVNEMEHLVASGNLDYRLGTTEDVLASMPDGHLGGSFDTFGAFLYSPNRIHLLDLLWKKSKEHSFHSIVTEGVDDKVTDKSGEKPLGPWLQANASPFRYLKGNEDRGTANRIQMVRGNGEFPLPPTLEQTRKTTSQYESTPWVGPGVERPVLEYRLGTGGAP